MKNLSQNFPLNYSRKLIDKINIIISEILKKMKKLN